MTYFLTSNPIKDATLNEANSFITKLRKELPNEIKLLFVYSNPFDHDKTIRYGNIMKDCF